MRNRLTWLAGTAVALLGVALAAPAQEEGVALDKVPKAVLDAFHHRFKDARPTGAAKETEDGKTVYEVTFKDNDKNVDVTLSPEGTLLMIEKEVTRKELPKAVKRAVKQGYPGAKVRLAEEITRVEAGQEKLAYYEVQLRTAEAKALEVQLSPEGKVLKEEKDSDDAKK